MLSEMVGQVNDFCILGVVVANVIRGLATLMDPYVDIVCHGDGLQLKIIGPYTVGAHVGDVVIKALLVVDEELVVVLVGEEVVAGALAELEVVVLGAEELVGDGAEEAVSVVADVADGEGGGVQRAREGVDVELLAVRGRGRRGGGGGGGGGDARGALAAPHAVLQVARAQARRSRARREEVERGERGGVARRLTHGGGHCVRGASRGSPHKAGMPGIGEAHSARAGVWGFL